MNWLWEIAIKKAGVAIITTLLAYLASPKVVGFLAMLAEKGFHVQINIDQNVATLTTIGLLTVVRNYLKVKQGLKFL